MTDGGVQSFLKDLKKKHKKKRKRDEGVSERRSFESEPKEPKMELVGKIAPTNKLALTPLAKLKPMAPKPIPFDYRYILAPMVGASELAFRLLCRRYGAQVAYTPMMNAHQFAHDANYRRDEFQTCAEDRPLVVHVSANRPDDFAAAVRVAAPFCDAIDLNLGCPQRTAYLGHFGSYLLDESDRELVCNIVRAGAEASDKPIFCKIRLLDTLEDTISLCRQLRDAGASLIAVHARYRASWERKGPGARDGPALLDQVAAIKEAVEGIPIIANGNVIDYNDVESNLQSTNADGVMSAEGMLDQPALFLPQWGSREDRKLVEVPRVPTLADDLKTAKKKLKLEKKLRKIAKLETKRAKGIELDQDQLDKLASKQSVLASLRALKTSAFSDSNDSLGTETISLTDLHAAAADPLLLAQQYLVYARRYPVKLRSVVFHIRRMLKKALERYQLMPECLACETIDQVAGIVDKMMDYRRHPESFVYDRQKAQAQKEALERKKREEGKRQAYEARMIRKAKREGKTDLHHYLHIGAQVPSPETIQRLRSVSKDEALQVWKQRHSQHCLSFHLDPQGCQRGRACAFLHADVNAFVETDEVAG